MSGYKVEFSYMIEQFGETVINADDAEQAEEFAMEYVRETYPEASHILMDEVKII